MNNLLGTGLVYRVEMIVDGEVVDESIEHNIMPQQSVDHIAGMIRGSGPSPISGWYVGLFESNYVPDSSVRAADLQTTVGESQAYDEANRPAWSNSYDGVGFIGNSGNPIEFTMNASKTIYGAFIASDSVKGGTAGILLSIARFSTAKTVEAGTTLRITAGLTLTPTAQL